MTLNEAIYRYKTKAAAFKRLHAEFGNIEHKEKHEEFKQLTEWLEELKRYKKTEDDGK